MLKIESKFDPNRLYHGYYLDEYEKVLFDKKIDPCDRYKDKYPELHFKKVNRQKYKKYLFLTKINKEYEINKTKPLSDGKENN